MVVLPRLELQTTARRVSIGIRIQISAHLLTWSANFGFIKVCHKAAICTVVCPTELLLGWFGTPLVIFKFVGYQYAVSCKRQVGAFSCAARVGRYIYGHEARVVHIRDVRYQAKPS